MRRIGAWMTAVALVGGCGSAANPTGVGDPTPTTAPTTAERVTTTVESDIASGSTEVRAIATTVSTTAPDAAPTTTAPPTLPPTSLAPTTAASTTSSLAPEPIVLRADGLGGGGRIGDPAETVVAAISARLGAPTSDDSMQFASEPSADGWFATPDGEYAFSAPVARTVCWPRELCATFGGRDGSALTLRGWTYAVPGAAEIGGLTTASGLTVGRRWSEFVTEISAPPGGCYSIGYGRTAEGIDLQLSGGTWSRFSEEGDYEALLPDPAEVTITGLSVGDRVVSLYEDC